jgi:hypothetical protein
LEAITRRLVLLLCLSAAGALSSLYLSFFRALVPTLVCALATAALLLMLRRQWTQWGMARLILDSQIVQVCSGTVSSRQGSSQWKPRIANQITVSTFGVLMNDRAYKWGYDGIQLWTAEIDRDTLSLTFGDREQAYRVELLHGIRELAEVDSLVEKLRYETGVLPTVRGW